MIIHVFFSVQVFYFYLFFDKTFFKNRFFCLIKINWRPVICGVILQFLMGIFCIRMDIGRSIFTCLGNKVAKFFDYAKQGAEFVYGTQLIFDLKVFAFSVSNCVIHLI